MKSLENSTPYEFLAGDLNLLEITGSIQHLVNDAYVYHYQTEDPQTVILNDLKDELRMFVSVRDLDHLLNVERQLGARRSGSLHGRPPERSRVGVR